MQCIALQIQGNALQCISLHFISLQCIARGVRAKSATMQRSSMSDRISGLPPTRSDGPPRHLWSLLARRPSVLTNQPGIYITVRDPPTLALSVSEDLREPSRLCAA